MAGWKNEHQKELLLPLTDLFFEKFDWVIQNCDREFGKKYVIYLTPTYADLSYVCDKLQEKIETIPTEHAMILRATQDKLDLLNQIKSGQELS
jgi:hypothetical protein